MTMPRGRMNELYLLGPISREGVMRRLALIAVHWPKRWHSGERRLLIAAHIVAIRFLLTTRPPTEKSV